MPETEVFTGYSSVEEAIAANTPTETVAETPPATPPANTEPPAATEPPPASTEPPASEPPPIEITPELSLKAINTQLGTNYQSLDEINSLKEEIAAIPTYKEIKTKFETEPPKPKFASPRLEELNTFIAATNIDDEGMFKSLKQYTNSDKTDHIQALTLAKLIANPDLIDDADKVRQLVASEYRLEVDEDADPDTENRRVEMEKFKLKMAAQEANKSIEQLMGKVTSYKEALPPDNTIVNQQKMESNQLQWKTTVSDNTFKDNLKAWEWQVPLGKVGSIDLGTENVKFELTEEQFKNAHEFVSSHVLNNGVEHTPEQIKEVIELAKNVTILGNFQEILQKASLAAVEKYEKENLKAIHNPSVSKIETPKNGKTDMTEQEKLKIYIDTGKYPE